MQKSLFGLNENIAGALCYAFGPISGIVALVMERENKFVRFHALQSTIWFLFLLSSYWVLGLIRSILGVIPLIGGLFGLLLVPVLVVGNMVYWGSKIVLAYKAYEGKTYKIPVVGDVVWNQINK